jgi:polyhydroxybutyrate depolymerase
MTGQFQAELTRYEEKADAENFVVVHPDGVDRQWNVGCPTDTGIDDTTFVLEMLELVKNNTCVDTRRVYATGFSAGGFLAHTLAWNTSAVFAAVAPHSGMMCSEYVDAPIVPVPTATFHMHGTADMIVPYEGLSLFFPTAEESLLQWADVNQCDLASREVTWRGPPGNSVCETFTRCAKGVVSTLCSLDGWGHNWYRSSGAEDGEFDSTDFSWQFLSQWSLSA